MGFSVHRCVMETWHVKCSNNSKQALLAFCDSKAMWQQEQFIITIHVQRYMTTIGSRPYPQSVGVRRKREDAKWISGSTHTVTDSASV